MAFSGDFTPVIAKHTKSFNLIDMLAVRCRPDSKKLRANASSGGRVAAGANHRRTSKAGPLRPFLGSDPWALPVLRIVLDVTSPEQPRQLHQEVVNVWKVKKGLSDAVTQEYAQRSRKPHILNDRHRAQHDCGHDFSPDKGLYQLYEGETPRLCRRRTPQSQCSQSRSLSFR